jgi:hypothetical protein
MFPETLIDLEYTKFALNDILLRLQKFWKFQDTWKNFLNVESVGCVVFRGMSNNIITSIQNLIISYLYTGRWEYIFMNFRQN